MSIYGPCVVCGGTNYSLSLGGPTICPACDCGIPPETTKARREAEFYRAKADALAEALRELLRWGERIVHNIPAAQPWPEDDHPEHEKARAALAAYESDGGPVHG